MNLRSGPSISNTDCRLWHNPGAPRLLNLGLPTAALPTLWRECRVHCPHARNMSFSIMPKEPEIAVKDMRRRIYGGARLLLDSLSDEELVALQPLLIEGEAEIINEACKPYVVRSLPKW